MTSRKGCGWVTPSLTSWIVPGALDDEDAARVAGRRGHVEGRGVVLAAERRQLHLRAGARGDRRGRRRRGHGDRERPKQPSCDSCLIPACSASFTQEIGRCEQKHKA